MGFTPTGYKELFVVKKTRQEAPDEGRENRQVEMICLYPGNGETARGCEQVADGDSVVATSEMVVKYII